MTATAAAVMRDGVGASRVFLPQTPAFPATTLLEFFTHTFPNIAANLWLARFEQGDIVDGQGNTQAAQDAYRPGQHLFYFRHVPHEAPIPFEAKVIYQDDHLVVADKPHFLPVTPSGKYVQETLLIRLKRQLMLPELSPLHRLDRDTAGLVLFSVQAHERGAYQQLFHNRQVNKAYLAVAPFKANLSFPLRVENRLEDSKVYMQMHETQGAPNSLTHIELQRRLAPSPDQPHNPALACYTLKPITGKRHQLRVHMMSLGIPICNDGIYPTLTPEQHTMTALDYAHPLQLLAQSIQFLDPITQTQRHFQSERSLQLAT